MELNTAFLFIPIIRINESEYRNRANLMLSVRTGLRVLLCLIINPSSLPSNKENFSVLVAAARLLNVVRLCNGTAETAV